MAKKSHTDRLHSYAQAHGKDGIKRNAPHFHKAKSKAKANPKAPLGEGGRFAAIEQAAAASGATHPAAVAAAAGIKKYGKAKMAKMAAAGRKKG